VDVGLEASYKAFWGVGLVVMAVCQVIFLLVDRLLSLASQLLQGAVGGMDCVDGQETDVGLVLGTNPGLVGLGGY
jgi:hypothetical protein